MLMIKSKNEDLIIELCKNMKDCKVVVCGQKEEVPAPVRIEGTCSACPHFVSANTEGSRAHNVKWGFCDKVNANVNETRKCCSLYENERKEVRVEESEVKRLLAS